MNLKEKLIKYLLQVVLFGVFGNSGVCKCVGNDNLPMLKAHFR